MYNSNSFFSSNLGKIELKFRIYEKTVLQTVLRYLGVFWVLDITLS